MVMTGAYDLAAISSNFQIDGVFLSARPHGSGHINLSYCVSFGEGRVVRRYLLQRLNSDIFKQPALVMENICQVTSHIAKKLDGEKDAARRALTLVLANNGRTWHREVDGSCWRMFHFIENARTYDWADTPSRAFQTAKAFGSFQQLLADMPASRLHETIPAFHNTRKRFFDLELAIQNDTVNRAARAVPEITFALSRKSVTGILLDANLPERVTHNDTKLSNILFDAATDKTLCVVDLDTVMQGLALYDFGDMVRTATSPTREDEQNLSRVTMNFPLFEALVRGYLSSAGEFLTSAEREYLPFSGKLISFEQGIRFLTDYLVGDMYYKVSRPHQNLDRCRTQFKLVNSIERQEAAMQSLLHEI